MIAGPLRTQAVPHRFRKEHGGREALPKEARGRASRRWFLDRHEPLDPSPQHRVTLERAHQSALRFPQTNHGFLAQPQQRPQSLIDILVGGQQLPEVPDFV